MSEAMSDERLETYRAWSEDYTNSGTFMVKELVAEIDRLKAENAALKDTSRWEIVGTYLVERHDEGDRVEGYGIVPYSDMNMIIDLSSLRGWTHGE
jgi:hypothetical protein